MNKEVKKLPQFHLDFFFCYNVSQLVQSMMMLVLLKILSSASRSPRQISDPAGDCRVNPCVEEEGVCGQGAECEDVGPCPECQCLPGHHGDPYDGGCIAGECGQNSDCGPQRACKDYKCVDPCALSCGQNTDCEVRPAVTFQIYPGFVLIGRAPALLCSHWSSSCITLLSLVELLHYFALIGRC